MTDLSSRPHCSPGRCSQQLERRIVALRFVRRWGPHRIGYHLGVPRSTVGRVRKTQPVRYEKSRPGQLIHVDIKKQGRIPDGGGHRINGRITGRRIKSHRGGAKPTEH